MTNVDVGQIASKAGAPMPGELPAYLMMKCGDCIYRADEENVRPEADCYHPEAGAIKSALGFKAYERIPPSFPAEGNIKDHCDRFAFNMRGD